MLIHGPRRFNVTTATSSFPRVHAPVTQKCPYNIVTNCVVSEWIITASGCRSDPINFQADLQSDHDLNLTLSLPKYHKGLMELHCTILLLLLLPVLVLSLLRIQRLTTRVCAHCRIRQYKNTSMYIETRVYRNTAPRLFKAAPRLFKAIYMSSRVRIIYGPCEQVHLYVVFDYFDLKS